MPKKLIVCADGTWNDEDASGVPTNVAKLHRALQNHYVERKPQYVHYQAGVGTRWHERLPGGAMGFGINRNIRECYEFLVDHYERGDELYFFGFSRGAYTVRSLAGLIRNAGIVRNRSSVKAAMALYRNRREDTKPGKQRAIDFRRAHSKPARLGDLPSDGVAPDDETLVFSPEIQMIGVWDTVGSLGLPWPVPKWLRPLFIALGINWWFHDTNLSTTVRNAYHAIAIHEHRSDFAPTLWTKQTDKAKASTQKLEQVWFAGVHCDVGGGYGANGLSDVTFKWMVEKATSCGLAIRPHAVDPGPHFAPEPLGREHDSWVGAFWLFDKLRFRWNGTPREYAAAAELAEDLAPEVITRHTSMANLSWPGTFLDELVRRASSPPPGAASPGTSSPSPPPSPTETNALVS